MLQLDETSHAATLTFNADLGAYASALGSAQRLPNGHYHFDLGLATNPSGRGAYARSLELNLSDDLLYGIQFPTIEYRSFRMANLYTAP